MTTIQLKKNPIFEKPQWSKGQALSGEEVELQVNAQDLLPDQSVHFEIRDAANQIVAVVAADGSQKQKWLAANPPAAMKFSFYALLREKPSPKNGHTAVVQRLKSGELEVKGTKLSVVSVDEAFVPKQEKLELKYKLEGAVPAKGRIEVWGERYPVDKPLYTEDFTPVTGEKEWKTWDGKSNDGKKYLNSQTADAYLTPEFSPYRIRIIVGPDDDSVKEPAVKGKGKVALIEKQFEIKVETIKIQVQNDIVEAAAEDKYKLRSVLMVPLNPEISITGASQSSPIVITTATDHKLADKDEICISGVQGNTAANGNFVVRLITTTGDQTSPTKFTLHKDKNYANTTGNAAYTANTGKIIAYVNRPPMEKEGETGRIRIPCVRHTLIGESLNQGTGEKIEQYFTATGSGAQEFTLTGGKKIKACDKIKVYLKPTGAAKWTESGSGAFSRVNETKVRVTTGLANGTNVGILVDPLHYVEAPYMAENSAPLAGQGSTKYDVDKSIYTRPEIPFELVPHLKSRLPDKNKKGLFEKESASPVIYQLATPDAFLKDLYVPRDADREPHARFFRLAATCVKKGKHDKPVHDANKVVITHWLARFKIESEADDAREFQVSAAFNKLKPDNLTDPLFIFKKGSNELRVYLNLAQLEGGTTDECDKLQKDYEEVDNEKIKVRKNLVKKGDLLWVVRAASGLADADKATNWQDFPPGTNTHLHYKGIRGVVPTDDLVGPLRKAFSSGPAGSEPIIGKGSAWEYKDLINLDPKKVAAASRQLVESYGVTKDGKQKGMGGVIFSPSVIGGDSYHLDVLLEGCPFHRSFGAIDERALESQLRVRTGPMTVWRLLELSESWRMPPRGTENMNGTVGENDKALKDRDHTGDGRKMNFKGLLDQGKDGFSEWIIQAKDGLGTEPHRNVDLAKYRKFFSDKATAGEAGFYNMADNSSVTNIFVAWDHYREQLPPGLAAKTGQEARNAIATHYIRDEGSVADGADPAAAMQAVDDGITDWNADPGVVDATGPDAAVANPIPVYAGTANEYLAWVKKKCKTLANEYMDALIPQQNPSKSMKVLRWPELYWDSIWYKGNPGAMAADKGTGIGGYCRGSGQAFFFSVSGQATTFEHEMGHSVHLAHFAAASETNFAWKHHDNAYQHCLMGYNKGDFNVPLPDNKVGSAINIKTQPRKWLCPKCLLKMRGWNELLVPCYWDHPDVF